MWSLRMNTIKYLILLMFTLLIAALVYSNNSYFLNSVTLTLSFKEYIYNFPELPTLAYLVVCFLFGMFFSGLNTLSTKFCLNRSIREKETLIGKLTSQIDTLQTELDVFINDPYIKKGLEDKAEEIKSLPERESIPTTDEDKTEDVSIKEPESDESALESEKNENSEPEKALVEDDKQGPDNMGDEQAEDENKKEITE